MKKFNGYIDTVFTKQDALLEEVIATIEENGMPAISFFWQAAHDADCHIRG